MIKREWNFGHAKATVEGDYETLHLAYKDRFMDVEATFKNRYSMYQELSNTCAPETDVIKYIKENILHEQNMRGA